MTKAEFMNGINIVADTHKKEVLELYTSAELKELYDLAQELRVSPAEFIAFSRELAASKREPRLISVKGLLRGYINKKDTLL